MSRVKIVASVLVVVGAVVWRAYEGPPARDTVTTPTAPVASSTPTQSAPPDFASAREKAAFPVEKVHRLVAGFTAGWLLHARQVDRSEALTRYATKDLVAGLVVTDIRGLPKLGTVGVGLPVVVEATSAYVVLEQKLTDGTGLLLRVAHIGGGRWRVRRLGLCRWPLRLCRRRC